MTDLISLVQQYEELYNSQHEHYNNHQRRESIWDDIGAQLGETSITCKEKWQRIRENFRKALILRITKSGRSAKKLKPPKYYRELSFLTPHLTYEENKANNALRNMNMIENPLPQSPQSEVEYLDDDSLHSDSSSYREPKANNLPIITSTITHKPRSTSLESPPTASAPANTVASFFKEYYVNIKKTTEKSNTSQNESSDTLTDFFITMAKTVKGFPLKKQLEIKAALFEMVHNVETEICNEETDLTD